MDSNKKKNSVRYKCQVRDINKKSVSNTRFNLTFVLSRKLLGRSPAAPFLCNFRANFAAAMRVSKGTNAGQALVRPMPCGTINCNFEK